jgi:hypothetical protein
MFLLWYPREAVRFLGQLLRTVLILKTLLFTTSKFHLVTNKLLNAKSILFISCSQYVLEHTESSSTIIAQNVPVNVNLRFGTLFKIFSKEEISLLLQLREVFTQIKSSEKLTDLKSTSLRTNNWQVSFQHKLHAKHWNAFRRVLS